MAVFPLYLRSNKILSRAFELNAGGAYHLFSFAVCHANLYPKRDLKTKDRAGIQVIKEIKPRKVVALQKNKSRFASRTGHERQRRAQELPVLHNEEIDTYEDEFASAASKYSSKMAAHQAEAEFTKSLVKGVRAVGRHTIKHKYFKPPPFPDLLTWAAKEQIRYLHRTNPEVWPVEELSEHFPVSEGALRLILKDNRRMFREEDILKHDQGILGRWNNLYSQMESGDISEEDYSIYLKCFFNSEHKCLVQNAISLRDIPYQQRYRKVKKPGPLSAIVQDCLLLQEKATEVLVKDKIPSVTKDLSSKLQDITMLLSERASDDKRARGRKPSMTTHSPGFHDSYPINHHMKNLADETGFLDSSMPTEVHIDKDKPSASGTYIKNKSVYDENGEFLYKIP